MICYGVARKSKYWSCRLWAQHSSKLTLEVLFEILAWLSGRLVIFILIGYEHEGEVQSAETDVSRRRWPSGRRAKGVKVVPCS